MITLDYSIDTAMETLDYSIHTAMVTQDHSIHRKNRATHLTTSRSLHFDFVHTAATTCRGAGAAHSSYHLPRGRGCTQQLPPAAGQGLQTESQSGSSVIHYQGGRCSGGFFRRSNTAAGCCAGAGAPERWSIRSDCDPCQ